MKLPGRGGAALPGPPSGGGSGGGPLAGNEPELVRARPHLVDLFADLLSLAYSSRTQPDLGNPEEVRARILSLLGRTEEQGRELGHDTQQVDEARFAVVALLDEVVLSSTWSGRDSWRGNPLQRELFRINTAGEEFFTRLDRLRADAKENLPSLEVFHTCLALGFEGKYKLLGPDRLQALYREIAGELSRSGAVTPDHLAPAWKRPDDVVESAGERVPIWATVGAISGAVLLLILLFALASGASAGHIAASIRELYVRISG
jgi:type VI secretion system protein ImpK